MFRVAPHDEKQQIVRTIILPNNEKQPETTRDESELLRKQLFELQNYHDNFVVRAEPECLALAIYQVAFVAETGLLAATEA